MRRSTTENSKDYRRRRRRLRIKSEPVGKRRKTTKPRSEEWPTISSRNEGIPCSLKKRL